ncbi:MAG: hypothetical protein LRY72_06425 [Saccharospirillaceae bacterium]|nr:hypothetical protein [Saccharospirillaceae bacterium]
MLDGLNRWRHQQQYKASRTADWLQLASNEAENEFGLYQAALTKNFIDALPIQQLPGSNQDIEWQHILAWCSRDQNARYQNYYQWRAAGTGFSFPAKSPAVLLQIVLGMVDDGRALHEFEIARKAVDSQKKKLQSLHDEPSILMNHVRRQLDRRLNTNSRVPFRRTDLFEQSNLIDIAKQRLSGYARQLEKLSDQLKATSTERQLEIERRTPINSAISLIRNEIDQLEAIVAGNYQELERLIKDAQSLQEKLPSRCDPGNRLLRDCSYVLQRVNFIQIDRSRQANEHKRSSKDIERDLLPLKQRLKLLETEARPYDLMITTLDQKSEEINHHMIEVITAKELLSEAIEDYEFYENVIQGKEQTAEIHNAEIRLAQLESIFCKKKTAYENLHSRTSKRKKAISSIMNSIAEYLPMFSWGVFNDDDRFAGRPFQLGPSHSTTYSVLEILSGDIACLIDSQNEGSLHPGFLIHDSPREAEMSEQILWALLESVQPDKGKFFQYIVTTSTEPSEAFKDYERLRLNSASDKGLLFRQPLSVSQGSLN